MRPAADVELRAGQRGGRQGAAGEVDADATNEQATQSGAGWAARRDAKRWSGGRKAIEDHSNSASRSARSRRRCWRSVLRRGRASRAAAARRQARPPAGCAGCRTGGQGRLEASTATFRKVEHGTGRSVTGSTWRTRLPAQVARSAAGDRRGCNEPRNVTGARRRNDTEPRGGQRRAGGRLLGAPERWLRRARHSARRRSRALAQKRYADAVGYMTRPWPRVPIRSSSSASSRSSCRFANAEQPRTVAREASGRSPRVVLAEQLGRGVTAAAAAA